MSNQNSGEDSLPSELLDAAIGLWTQDDSIRWITVSGRSIMPVLREGDLLLIDNKHQSYEPGVILTVRHSGEIISHRVLAIHTQADGKVFYITKGDNSPYLDPAFNQGEVIGQVMALRRGSREISFETSQWKRVNRNIAKAMSVYSRIYPHTKNNQEGSSRSFSLWLRIACYHIMQGFYRLVVQIFLLLFGGWKRI